MTTTLQNTPAQHALDLSRWTRKLNKNQKGFLKAFGCCGNIVKAASHSGVHAKTHYYWKRTSESYREAFAYAQETACEIWEAEAVRRAVDGVSTIETYRGEPIMVALRNENGDVVTESKFNEDGSPKLDASGAQVTGAVLHPLTKKEYSDKLLIELLKHHNPARYNPALKIESEVSGVIEHEDRSLPAVEVQDIGQALIFLEQIGLLDQIKHKPDEASKALGLLDDEEEEDAILESEFVEE